MSTHPAVREWTYEEFSRLPDDGNRYEVIAGELYVTPAPGNIHQRVAARLTHLFEGFSEETGAGIAYPAPFDMILRGGDYVQPDLSFVRHDRVDEVVKDHAIVGVPDLVVEILSDSTARRDRGIKRERYAAHGVPEYWIIDTDAGRVEIHRLIAGDLRRVDVVADVLRYQPIAGGPELVIDVPYLLRPANDFSPRPR